MGTPGNETTENVDVIQWDAEDLLTLGEELQKKIAKVHSDAQRAMASAGDEPYEDNREEVIKKIHESFSDQVERLKQTGNEAELYNEDLAGIEMGRLVYSEDRNSLISMLSDPRFAWSVNQALADSRPFNARKELLTRGLKLTRGMAPLVYGVIDRCADALQLKTPVEVYVYQDTLFNAACYPPRKDKVLLMLTSSLLEKFDEQELAFVIGHEIGHYLFEHTRYPVNHILGLANASPLDAMRLYAWIRNAEVTADRTGMVCCQSFDAAASSFFKLSSGVTGTRLRFSLEDYLTQLSDLQSEMSDNDPEVWFSTHPFSPLRIKALEIFVNGATYHDFIGKSGQGVSVEETDAKLKELMSIMEPSYLYGDGDISKKAQRYMLTAGYLMAAINGVVEDSEIEALGQVLGEEADTTQIEDVQKMNADDVRTEVVSLSKELNHLLDVGQKMNMMSDIAIISYADGTLDDMELDCLHWMCEGFDIPSHCVDHVLMNARYGVD